MQKNNVASLPPKSPKFEDDVPQHRVLQFYANSISGSLGTHSSSSSFTTGIQPSKNYRGKLKMDSDFGQSPLEIENNSPVSATSQHTTGRQECIATFQRIVSVYWNQCTHNQYIHIDTYCHIVNKINMLYTYIIHRCLKASFQNSQIFVLECSTTNHVLQPAARPNPQQLVAAGSPTRW